MNVLDLYTLPTLHQGHFANLKIDTGEVRVWLSRMTIADGEKEPVSVEKKRDGVWVPFHGDVVFSQSPGDLWIVRWIDRGENRREYDKTVYDLP